MGSYLAANAGLIVALATVALLFVTTFYAWVTHRLLNETKLARINATTPRVAAYLRQNEVHGNIVQVCIANLSEAAACNVTARMETVTEWPDPFDLDKSQVLRDISFLNRHEVLKFDVGVGPELFREGIPAVFKMNIEYRSIDDRKFIFEKRLKVESVDGHGTWQTFGVHDIATKLDKIAKSIDGWSRFTRLKVDTFSSEDRANEK